MRSPARGTYAGSMERVLKGNAVLEDLNLNSNQLYSRVQPNTQSALRKMTLLQMRVKFFIGPHEGCLPPAGDLFCHKIKFKSKLRL